jgi:hypothetical protein
MANTISNIFGKLKDKFNNTSSSNVEENDKLKQSLNAGKTISIKAPKSERYTYYAGLAGKKLEKFRPETQEEKDTLSPIGFFRTGERQAEAQKKIQERIKAAASMMNQKELTPDQEKLVTAQAQREQPFTQDIPSTAIKKLKYDPKTEELYVTFNGSNKKYWYPNVPKEKVEELMEAPSKGEYFLKNIHDQYSVNYQLHKTHKHQGYLGNNRAIKKYYKNMRDPYAKGKRKGSMKGVLNNGRS